GAQTVPGRPCCPGCSLVEDDASNDSAAVLIVRILTGPRLCVSTLSGGAAGLELTQACQRLECGVLAAEDIGDGNGGHGAGNQGRVRGLIGEVVSGDVGAVAGEADDLDVDESVLIDQLRQAQGSSGPGTHGGEQDVGLSGQGTELLRALSSLEVDPTDVLALRQLPIVFGDGTFEGVADGRFDLDHPGAELRQS